MFIQDLNPLGNLGLTVVAALVPVVALLVMLAVFRITAWLATLIGSVITLIMAIAIWHRPLIVPDWQRERGLGGRLDHVLGLDRLQHAQADGSLRYL